MAASPFQTGSTVWLQKDITLKRRKRGVHLVTDELVSAVPELSSLAVGTAHFFLKHTSAALTINENCDSDVRADMETILNRVVPEDARYRHSDEGADDMPAHAKSSLIGVSVTVPIANGALAFGTWQGVHLCEARDSATPRTVTVTLHGLLRP